MLDEECLVPNGSDQGERAVSGAEPLGLDGRREAQATSRLKRRLVFTKGSPERPWGERLAFGFERYGPQEPGQQQRLRERPPRQGALDMALELRPH